MTDRIRPAFVSEIAFTAEGQPRPIHIFRAGTFTSMDGNEHTYTPDHIRSMLENFAAGKRKRPPITERHDYGRAVGRIAKLWADDALENLYAQPSWNTEGKRMLSDEVYDGFSCEIEHVGDGRILIGGSLTNYPAVDGLEPVMLEAPKEAVSLPPQLGETRPLTAISMAYEPPRSSDLAAAFLGNPVARPPRVDMHSTIPKETRMSEDIQETAAPAPQAPAASFTLPPQIAASDPAVQAQVTELMAQMRADAAATRALALEEARAQFAREMAEERARTAISSYAQHVTTPTMSRPYALPIDAAAISAALHSLSAAQRSTIQGLFDRILDAGLVSFDEIGSQGEGAPEQSARAQFEAAVQVKVDAGLTKFAAMQAVGKADPELYSAYQAESSRRGAVQVKKGAK